MENAALYEKLRFEEGEGGLYLHGFREGCGEDVEELIIPDSWNVVAIFKKGYWHYEAPFYRAQNLRRVRLPATLRRLESAFTECRKLEEVIFPEGMTALGTMNFRDCTALKHVSLPPALTEIGYGNFDVDGGLCLDDSYKENGVYYVGSYLLYGKCHRYSFDGNGVVLKVREGTTLIASCACASSTYTEVIFPASLRYIGKQAFYSCNDLRAPALPEGLLFIGEGAFENENGNLLRGYHVTDGVLTEDGQLEIKKELGFLSGSQRAAAKALFEGKLLKIEYIQSWTYDDSDDDRVGGSSSSESKSVKYGRIDATDNSTALLRVDGEIRGVVFRVDPQATYGPSYRAFFFDGSVNQVMSLGYSASHSSQYLRVTRISLVGAGVDGAPERGEYINFTPSGKSPNL